MLGQQNGDEMKLRFAYSSVKFITIILGIASAYFISLVANDNSLKLWAVALLLVAIGIIVWVITDVTEKIRTYEFENAIRGLWIQKHIRDNENDQTYCLIEIGLSETKQINLNGTLFSKEGKFIANWHDKYVGVDSHKRMIVYIYDGEYDKGSLYGNGYGKMEFNCTNKCHYQMGKGYFQDSKSDFNPISYDFERIDNGLCKEIIGHDVPNELLHRNDFVKKYHIRGNKREN
jgi:hypothetical protein